MSATAVTGLTLVDPVALAGFEAAWLEYQEAKRHLWQAAAAVWESATPSQRPYVDDELALVMNCHPATAEALVVQACQAFELGTLVTEWSAGRLTDRHVAAAVEQLGASLTDDDQRRLVLDRVLDRCRRRAADGHDWPTPGELKRLIRVAALLLDPDGAARRKEQATADRGVHASALPHGQAMLALEGPEERITAMWGAVQARAAELARQPGETRTRAQLEFDAAEDLLLSTATGRQQVTIEAQVVVPIDTATGDGDALGELPVLGPVLPGTCRDLLARADVLRRICVDATGQVVAVDAPVPVGGDATAIAAALARFRVEPVQATDLGSDRYRPGPKALRFVRTRDRTCRFPGCTRPASASDVDHRIPWPRGRTHPANLQCLCRHHHRAKQSGLFTVHVQPDGSTAWTLTATGAVYRRPPPEITPTF